MKLWPSMGTRSVLFGVHAFWFHPITVWLAWKRLYKSYPNRWECLAILLHDIGYWGCENMDGLSGKQHPYSSALIAKRLACLLGARQCEALYVEALILGHSRSFCVEESKKLSELCDPDKFSVLYDPAIFYWLRGTLSGEINEYWHREEQRQNKTIKSSWTWLQEYRQKVRARFIKNL